MAFIALRRKKPTVAELPHEVYAREEPTTDLRVIAELKTNGGVLPNDVQIYADSGAIKALERLPYYSRPSLRAKSIIRSGFRYRLVWLKK